MDFLKAFSLLLLLVSILLASPGAAKEHASKMISFEQLGAEAEKQTGSATASITPTKDGAKLTATMQDLEAEATPDGLWITSTSDEDFHQPNCFRLRAIAIGRESLPWHSCPPELELTREHDGLATLFPLAEQGTIRAGKNSSVWMRPGLTEHYSASSDGLRQDFLIHQRPYGDSGRFTLHLDLTGAQAVAAEHGATLNIETTGRKLTYSRLMVTDATGRKLPAQLQVTATQHLTISVEDESAVYPVCIDPTFSDADWISMGGLPGADKEIHAVIADGAGNLFVGGAFTAIGMAKANRIAKWNGSSWSSLGSGVNGDVHALVMNGGELYAGGEFGTAGGTLAYYIAKWNGSVWSALGGRGLNGTVKALVANGGDLYAGGDFTASRPNNGGIVSANYVARWNGNAWSGLGSGMNSRVSALVISGGDLYAGGFFTTAGGVSASRIARWNGSAWSALNSGMNDYVRVLAVKGGYLYAGGYFTTAGGVSANRIARWNGSSWSTLGSGIIDGESDVYALAATGDDLYIGGRFTVSGATHATSIARWNGVECIDLGQEINGVVNALTVSNGELYTVGFFKAAAGVNANHIAKWNGSSWSSLTAGTNNSIRTLAVNGSDLYAGGMFTSVGGVSANYIAKWNGSTWSALGSGMNYSVSALAVNGSDLYAGGEFTTAGGVSANYIAKWNGNSWSALGSGMSNRVQALAMNGSDLYAGGVFTTAGSTVSGGVAKWNGSSWSALGSGVSGIVNAISVNGRSLYVGGEFAYAGGVSANNVARWDGGTWSALGSGMTYGRVNCLAFTGDTLYAGGSFILGSANYIAKWNGSTWSALGRGTYATVLTLTVSDNNLYAGGHFTEAGEATAPYVAKWDGIEWSPLGSGMNSSVLSLAAFGDDLYAGGAFSKVGDKVSAYLARANLAGCDSDSDGDGLLDSWEILHFAFRNTQGPHDDSDHDGYNELLELAFGLNPTVPDPGGIPGVLLEGGYLTMTISKHPGVIYEVQTASTLRPGQPNSFSAASTVVLVDDANTVKVRDIQPASAAARRFIRAVVTADP